MAYVTAADFRAISLASYCDGLALTEDECSTPFLTAHIAEMSEKIEWATNDFFESRSMTLELDGMQRATLVLPWRCTAITSVKTRDSNGTLTTQPSSVYRFKSSLDSAGALRLRSIDILEIIPGQYLSGLNSWDYTNRWPYGSQAVEVAGIFGWTVCPTRIKRAVALLVWDRAKNRSDVLQRASYIDTADARYTLAATPPEVQEIVADFKRGEPGF